MQISTANYPQRARHPLRWRGQVCARSCSSTNGPKGAANNASDAELVQLLRRKPKTTPELRTTQAFRKFFNGIQHERLLRLLNLAYASLDDASREQKVQKRMRLMKGHTCIVAVDEGENGTEMVEAVPLPV